MNFNNVKDRSLKKCSRKEQNHAPNKRRRRHHPSHPSSSSITSIHHHTHPSATSSSCLVLVSVVSSLSLFGKKTRMRRLDVATTVKSDNLTEYLSATMSYKTRRCFGDADHRAKRPTHSRKKALFPCVRSSNHSSHVYHCIHTPMQTRQWL